MASHRYTRLLSPFGSQMEATPMTRTRKTPPKIDTKTARAKIAPADKPYYNDAGPKGVDLGYRKPKAGPGSWYVRALNGEGGYWVKRVATADDVEPANGKDVFNYIQALDLARKIARGESSEDAAGSDAPLTVDAAIDLYLGDLKARGQNPVNATQIKFHMTRKLGTKVLSMTHPRDWREWRDGIMAKATIKPATINRIRKSVVAMCNLAAKLDPRIASNARAWKAGFEHLPGADQPREGVILADDVVRKIVPAMYREAGDEVGRFIETMAQAGTRPSQLAKAGVGDLLHGDRLAMPVSSKGRGGSKRTARTPVPISADLWRRLREAAGDRGAIEPLFHIGGRRFAHHDYARPFRRVVASLRLDDKTITAYSLRHSAIVRALLANVPVRVIAANCDTSVAMIERNYARFIANHSDAVARRSLLDIRIK
jgi:integrase